MVTAKLIKYIQNLEEILSGVHFKTIVDISYLEKEEKYIYFNTKTEEITKIKFKINTNNRGGFVTALRRNIRYYNALLESAGEANKVIQVSRQLAENATEAQKFLNSIEKEISCN